MKTNDEIINEYFHEMQIEINPSINYRKINRNTLNKLSQFHKNKPFMKMKREDIVAYLISLRKSEDIDPLHKWIGTYNLHIGNLIRFFKWLYNPTEDIANIPKPSPFKGIKRNKAIGEKISKALKEHYKTHESKSKGKKLSADQISKMREGYQRYIQEHGSPPNKGNKMSDEHKRILHEGLLEYIQKCGYPRAGKTTDKETLEKQRQGLLRYYQTHDVWNKGLSWSSEIRERIREGCLNSTIGMGPRGPWKNIVEEEEQKEEEVIV